MECQLLLVRYYHTILFSRIYYKDKSISSPSLMFSWEIYELFRSSHRRYFMKKDVLKKFRNMHRDCGKDTPTQMFSAEYCEIFKKTPIWRTSVKGYFWFYKTATEQRWAAAYVNRLWVIKLLTIQSKFTSLCFIS